MSDPTTWHYGVVARWWAEFNRTGPEIEYFRSFVERGQPALDVACGTGRILLPLLRAELDVDGCDISPDMLALCRDAAEREGLSPTLYAQPMHQLDLPRRYRTILVCGGFGLGSTHEQDLEALRRFHAHLEPGGLLILDNEAPYADTRIWHLWEKEARATLPQSWRPPGDRRKGSDGAEYELRTRVVELDPISQQVTMEMRASMWRDGNIVADETNVLHMTQYLARELVMMLEGAGFSDIQVRGDYVAEPPTADTDFFVFIARKG